MFEQEDAVVERVIEHLRRPVAIDPALDARVMQAVAAHPHPRRSWPWLAGIAAAAAVVALIVLRPPPWHRNDAGASSALEFVFVAPRAASVALVGDFNDWDPKRAPMRSANHAGVWATVVQLAPGRYRYAYLVNGVEWRADPAAPTAIDDEFGAPSSVVTVGGRGKGS
jgi:Carbohydrate-binding module 48 (Isoamylase N-terminal domain)